MCSQGYYKKEKEREKRKDPKEVKNKTQEMSATFQQRFSNVSATFR